MSTGRDTVQLGFTARNITTPVFFVDTLSTLALARTPTAARKLVDVRQQLPATWATLAEQAGITGSFRGIATAAGVATTTVTRLISEGRTSPETVTAVATALRVPEAKIYALANLSVHTDLGPWSPPAEANQLGGAERSVLEDLIRVMAKGEDNAVRTTKAEKSDSGLRPPAEPSADDREGLPDSTEGAL